jgi:hypothetical protein
MRRVVSEKIRKDRVVQEVNALIRLYDVTELQRLRASVEARWWEGGLRILLFVSGLGFIITAYKLIPHHNPILFWFVFSWVVLFVLTLLGLIEYLIFRIRALSRLYEHQARLVDDLLKEVGATSSSRASARSGKDEEKSH